MVANHADDLEPGDRGVRDLDNGAAGELGEGGSVEIKKKGTIFNVTRTVQS